MAERTPKPAPDDDLHRRFREALDRKQAKRPAGQGEDHPSGGGVGGSTNDKTTRRFRRKSGG